MKPKELAGWLDRPLPNDVKKELDKEIREHKCGGSVPYSVLVEGKVFYQQSFDVDGSALEVVQAKGKLRRQPDFPPEMNEEDDRGIYRITCGDCGETLYENSDIEDK